MAPSDRSSLVILDDTASSFEYYGDWDRMDFDVVKGDNGIPYNKSLIAASSNKNTSLSLNFEGKYVALWGTLDETDQKRAPKYKCMVDNKVDISPDGHQKLGDVNNEILCESGILGDGNHTVTLTVEDIKKDKDDDLPVYFDYATYEPLAGAQLNGTKQRIYPSDSRIKLSPSGWSKIKDSRNGDMWPNDGKAKLKNGSVNITFEGDVLLMYGFTPNGEFKEGEASYSIDGGGQQKFKLPAGQKGIRSYGQIFVNLTGLSATNHTLIITDTSNDPNDKKSPLTLSYFEIRGTVAPPVTNTNNSNSDNSTITSNDDSGKGGPNAGIMVGATLGALAVVAAIVWVVVAIRNRKQDKADSQSIGLKQAGAFLSGGGYKKIPNAEHKAW